jgi:hypothetical protein
LAEAVGKPDIVKPTFAQQSAKLDQVAPVSSVDSMDLDHAREVIAKADEDATKSAFLVIQEGGSSMEMYAHGHDTLEDAEADRFSCRDGGSYRTSEVIEVPETLASHPDFWDIAEQIAKAALDVDYPEGDNPNATEEADDEASVPEEAQP